MVDTKAMGRGTIPLISKYNFLPITISTALVHKVRLLADPQWILF